MRSRFVLFFVLSLFVMGLSVSAQDSTVTLQLAINNFAQDTMETVVAEYEALNPNIKIQLNSVQGGGFNQYADDAEEYQDDLVSTYSAADIIIVDSNLNSEITRAGYVLDLSPLIQSDPNFNSSNFHQSLLNSFIWDAGQWAIPISTDFYVMSYNPEAFDEAGLNYPAEWWTIYDLDNAVRELTQYDGEGNIEMPGINFQGFNSDVTIRNLFVSLIGHGVVDETLLPAEPDFSDPLLAEYMEVWNDMVNDGLFETPDDDDFDSTEVPIQIGNPQQVFGGGRGGPFGNTDDEEEAEVVATLLPGGYAGLSVYGYAISSGTRYPQEAYDFITYLVTDANAVNISNGTTPAIANLDTTTTTEEGGPGGGGGPGGNFGGTVVDEMEPLVDTALLQAITISQMRFSQGITSALDLMQSDSVDATTALIDITAEMQDRVAVADERYQTTAISVPDPEVEVILSDGEISIDFAVLGGGGGGGGAVELWEQIAEDFAANDSEVGVVNIEQENGNDLTTITDTYQCFYSSSNEVASIDISTILSLDPLLLTDASYDPNDFIGGVLEQVQIENQTYALPMQLSPIVIRYNQDMFSQAGLNPPVGTWTVSEFEDMLEQLMYIVEEDQAPLEFNSSSQTSVLGLMAIYGGIPFDTRTDPITIDFTSEASMNAIQQILNLVDEGKLEFSTQGGFGGGGGPQDSGVPLYSGTLNAIPFGFGGPGGQGNMTEPGIVTFPQGFDYNFAAYDISTAYISATAQYPEACYRFISYAAQTTDIFSSMPVRYSLINSSQLALDQGEETIEFYQSMADLIEQPNTIVLPANIDFASGAFGITTWFFNVIDSYISGEVVDLEADLLEAEQASQTYLECVSVIPPLDMTGTEGGTDPQEYFTAIQACQSAVTTD